MPTKSISKSTTRSTSRSPGRSTTRSSAKTAARPATRAKPAAKSVARQTRPQTRAPARSSTGARKAAPAKSGAPRGLSREVQPSPELAAVVGNRPMPRTEITRKLWDYIKKNGLQDKTNKQMINADEKLTAVFGGKRQVSMFEMNRLLNAHLT